MGLLFDSVLEQDHLLASLQAARAASSVATRVMGSEGSISPSELTEAMGRVLDTQDELFSCCEQLIQRATIHHDHPVTDGTLRRQAEEPDAFMKDLPEDWGQPRDWIDAPKRFFRRR